MNLALLFRFADTCAEMRHFRAMVCVFGIRATVSVVVMLLDRSRYGLVFGRLSR